MSNASSNDQHAVAPVGLQPTWGPLSAVLVTVAAYIGAQIIVGILLMLGFGRDEAWLETIAGQFTFVLMSDAVIVLALLYFLRQRHAKPAMLALGRTPLPKDLAYALLGFGTYFLLLIAATSLLSHFTPIDLNQKQETGFDNLFTSASKVMALISLVILPPIVEETVFRGFLFGGLRAKLDFTWAMLITSLVFAAPHLLASSHGLLWIAGVDTFVLSLVLCYVREQTGALWACMLIHAMKNGLAFLFLLAGPRF